MDIHPEVKPCHGKGILIQLSTCGDLKDLEIGSRIPYQHIAHSSDVFFIDNTNFIFRESKGKGTMLVFWIQNVMKLGFWLEWIGKFILQSAEIHPVFLI